MAKQQKVFKGALLTVAMRWSDRAIGLISMVVLARILVPEDFGIVAMASLIVGFVDVFLDLGVNQALIHNKDADQEDYDTAWSIRLTQALISGVIIILSAPLAAQYFNTPQLVTVLQVMAITLVVGGFENIGIIAFQKEMNFGRDFQFFFIRRFAGFILTLIIAVLYETYWAMVFGSLFGKVVGVVISYIMHSLRPRFAFTRFNQIWSFSKWVLFKNVGAYFDLSMDKVLVGRHLSPSDLGGYTVASEVSALPTTELLAPLGRVLFPAFVDKRQDPKEFAQRVLMAIAVQCLIAIPACIGLMYVATDLVSIVFGEKWLFAAPIIQIMAITNLIGTFAHSCGYALLALGKAKTQAIIIWVQSAVFVLVAVSFLVDPIAQDFAILRMAAVFVGSILIIGIVIKQVSDLKVIDVARNIVRPLLSVAVMFFVMYSLQEFLIDFNEVVRLGVNVSAGVFTYSISILICWLLFKKPPGAEKYIIQNILIKFKAA